MKLKHLRIIRIATALFFFSLITFFLIDYTQLFSTEFIKGILFFQFFPSIFLFASVIGFAGLGFVLIILITFFFGRVYCSAICPLGIMQDFIIRTRKYFRLKIRFKYARPHNWLRYSILAVVILSLLSGSMILIDLLDPYSYFGKIVVNLVRPVYLNLNNLIVSILEQFDIFIIHKVALKQTDGLIIGFSLVLFIVIIWFSIKNGRLFCNTICPVGSMLGLVSKYSILKINLDQSSCTLCGNCSTVCKSKCIDIKHQKVDFSRCVACYNCLDVCQLSAISYSGNTSIQKTEDAGRRKSIIAFATLLSSPFLLKSKTTFSPYGHNEAGSIPVKKDYPVSPPGSQGIDHFTGHCTACHLCVSMCPTQVLQPSIIEYKWKGLFQPHLDSRMNYCNYDCTLCTEICPSGAILPLTLKQKHTTQIGKVHFILDSCVVSTDLKDCGSCSEHCPTKAVQMVLWKYRLKIPEINPEICVGCGACEYACPTKPYKAIYVVGNPVHLIVKQPKVKSNEEGFNPENEFPF